MRAIYFGGIPPKIFTTSGLSLSISSMYEWYYPLALNLCAVAFYKNVNILFTNQEGTVSLGGYSPGYNFPSTKSFMKLYPYYSLVSGFTSFIIFTIVLISSIFLKSLLIFYMKSSSFLRSNHNRSPSTVPIFRPSHSCVPSMNKSSSGYVP